MSVKRQATTELNHENWDQEDPEEHKEMGVFKTASKDVLEKRVIRTAKRRSQHTGDEAKKSVFSGFGGFNKRQPSSFDFLANLTNGSKANNNLTPSKDETAVSSSLFSNKSFPSSPTMFSIPVSSTNTTKLNFGVSTSQTPTLFANTSVSTTTTSFAFKDTKADSTAVVKTLSKTEKIPSDTNDTNPMTPITNTDCKSSTSNIFGVSSDTNKSLFTQKVNNSSPFKMQPFTNTSSTEQPQKSSPKQTETHVSEKSFENKDENKNSSETKKLNYYTKLKGLNESVSDWIKKHVEETPLCILTPIFKDYEKYLKEIQEEYQGPDVESKSKTISDEKIASEATLNTQNTMPVKSTSPSSGNKSETSLFSNTSATNTSISIFKSQNNPLLQGEKSTFGSNIATDTSSNIGTTKTSFPFGINSNIQTTAEPFSFATNTTTNNNAPFSFGTGKPFSFNSNIQKPAETNDTNEEEDEPPKVEFTPVLEENSVYDKRCKVFVKKDNNFVDKGVGTLYIKEIKDNGKHQLLVRANTNLGNVLINLILISTIPIRRMGKNNVMMVCIPTPDSKPPPVPILIRVKTSEEADELLETLNKYKT